MASSYNEERGQLEDVIASLHRHDPTLVIGSAVTDQLKDCLGRIQSAESSIKGVRAELVSLSSTIRHNLDRSEGYPDHRYINFRIETDYEQEMVYPPPLNAFLSPLTEPLLRGWRRVFLDDGSTTCNVSPLYYISPNGTRLTSLEDIEKFLVGHHSLQLTIDQFTLDRRVSLHSKPLPKEYMELKLFITDISQGTENKPIPCFNRIDETTPTPFHYISSFIRSTEADVAVPTDRSFMLSCDCKDGCVSSSRCVCRQLTASEGKMSAMLGPLGYSHQRLPKQQISGIYECNQYCGCGPNCTNRVVQRGPKHRLAVFRTEKMGWGVMTLDDIPQGTFLCTYNGLVCSDAMGDKRGAKYGDEYLAELDYIEVMEEFKKGFEDDVVSLSCDELPKASGDIEPMSANKLYLVTATKKPVHTPKELTGSDSYLFSTSSETLNSSKTTHLETPLTHLESPLHTASDTSHEVSPSVSCSDSSVFVNRILLYEATSDSMEEGDHDVKVSTRQFYQEKHCYVIDCKSQGNIGRFINHSCSPNLFVQNVFVDTHDLRFPWVAFFTNRNIPTFSEVFWDYSYIVGSVEGRTIECLCGSTNCRKRLL